jgi:hypothetical protein
VNQHLGNKAKEEVLKESHREAEVGPIVPEFQGFQSVGLEVYLTIEVLLVEDFHGNLALSAVGSTVMFAVEVQIMLDGATSVFGLLVLAGRDGGSHGPEGHQNRNGSEDREENSCIETTTDLASKIPWDQEQQREEQSVGEAVAASSICWDGSIFNGRVL